MKILRIVSCIAACLFAAAAVLVGIFAGFGYALVCAAAAAAFAIVMVLAKNASEPKAPRRPDFMNSDEENEALRSGHDGK